MRIINKPSELGQNNPIISVQMCTQMRICVYESYTHMLCVKKKKYGEGP